MYMTHRRIAACCQRSNSSFSLNEKKPSSRSSNTIFANLHTLLLPNDASLINLEQQYVRRVEVNSQLYVPKRSPIPWSLTAILLPYEIHSKYYSFLSPTQPLHSVCFSSAVPRNTNTNVTPSTPRLVTITNTIHLYTKRVIGEIVCLLINMIRNDTHYTKRYAIYEADGRRNCLPTHQHDKMSVIRNDTINVRNNEIQR